MDSLNVQHQKAVDEIEYGLAKVDKEIFEKMSPDQQRNQRGKLAGIRIRQIESHPECYPQGITGSLRKTASL